MVRDLYGPRLRGVLRDIFARGRREAADAEGAADEPGAEPATGTPADAPTGAGA
jgi:hypothetical protein